MIDALGGIDLLDLAEVLDQAGKDVCDEIKVRADKGTNANNSTLSDQYLACEALGNNRQKLRWLKELAKHSDLALEVLTDLLDGILSDDTPGAGSGPTPDPDPDPTPDPDPDPTPDPDPDPDPTPDPDPMPDPGPRDPKVATDAIAGLAEKLIDRNPGIRHLNYDRRGRPSNEAMEVARTCIRIAAGLDIAMNRCGEPDLPIWVTGDAFPEKSQHDYDAIFGGPAGTGPRDTQWAAIDPHPSWGMLNYDKSKDKRTRWYTGIDYRPTYLAGGCTLPRMPTGEHCDEFPYMSTTQGGKPNPVVPQVAPLMPALRSIDGLQNGQQGNRIGNQLYSRCEMTPAEGATTDHSGQGGDAFLVIPVPAVPITTGLCNQGGGSGGGGVS